MAAEQAARFAGTAKEDRWILFRSVNSKDGYFMPLSDCRMLVVEDDIMGGSRISDGITGACGRVVGPFTTIVEALKRISDLGAIDGAVLDVGLEHRSSFPLAYALKTTNIPFLFLTGVNREDMPEIFASIPHMPKPLTDKGLVAAVINCGVVRD